jgi:glycosyltransferase involved in cell wall biosynthesis
MPTRDRRPFIPRAVRQFLDQDYPDRELVVVDDGRDPIADLLPLDPRIRYIRLDKVLALGAKRNLAAEKASGEILAHWDDDDWMAPWRLRYQVQDLLEAGADVCGVASLFFHDPAADRAWEYRYSGPKPWVAGGTLCYTRLFWNDHRFAEIGEGEDNDFLWRHGPRLLQQADHAFYVATVHSGNTSRKITTGPEWRPVPLGELPHRRSPSASFVPRPELPPDAPLVSCLMPTGGREAFARQAVRYFLRQTWPNKELVIVDDPGGGLAGRIPDDERILYFQTPRKLTVGAKLNLAVEASRGSLVARWDDDDWYAPRRLEIQARAFLQEEADICAPLPGVLFDVAAGRFWTCTPALWEKIFAHGVVLGAAMMYHRRLWENGLHHPDMAFPEDLLFLRSVLARGGRLLKIPNDGIFVCVRHPGNTWRFACGQEGGPQVWQTAPVPEFLPAEDLEFYCHLMARPGRPAGSSPHTAPLPLDRGIVPQPRIPGVTRSRIVVRKLRL